MDGAVLTLTLITPLTVMMRAVNTVMGYENDLLASAGRLTRSRAAGNDDAAVPPVAVARPVVFDESDSDSVED